MKTRMRILSILCFLCMVTLLLVGCNSSKQATAKAIISNDEAAKIIISDLKYHGVQAKQISITRITNTSDKKGAIVDYTLFKNDGTSQKIQTKLTMGQRGWGIESHNH